MAIKKVISDTELGQYMNFGTIEVGKLNPVLPTINTVPILTIPTTTGNTTNKNEFVTDSSGDKWFIDYAGDGIKFSNKPHFFNALPSNVVSNNVARTSITGWDIPVTAGKSYEVKVAGRVSTTSATTGVSLGMITASGAVGEIQGYLESSILNTVANTGLRVPIYSVNTVSTQPGSFLTTTGISPVSGVSTIVGLMYFTCTTSGRLQFQFGTEVTASPATLLSGSILVANLLN